jgi:hypothetical protein
MLFLTSAAEPTALRASAATSALAGTDERPGTVPFQTKFGDRE